MEYLYINTPKTAGTFTRRRVIDQNTNAHIIQGHSRCISDDFMKERMKHNEYYSSRPWFGVDLTKESIFEDAVKFTTLRNPYDLLSSYFISRWGDGDKGMRVKLPRLGFNDLIKEFCNTDKEWHVPFFRDFLYFNLFDNDGNSRCDYGIIYDTLDEGLLEFTNAHMLKYKRGGVENKTHGKRNYKQYYNQESIDLIAKKCKLELDMFNFDFNGYRGSEKIINISDLKIDWDKVLKR